MSLADILKPIQPAKMPIDLYYLPESAPCRAVQLAASVVGVELNLKLTNLMTDEHLGPEYLDVSVKAISM